MLEPEVFSVVVSPWILVIKRKYVTGRKFFSIDEERVLREKYAQHKDFLTSAFTNKVTNTGKLERWKEIADAVNALGYESRSVAEVKAKWKNMASKAKEIFNSFRKSQQETGGGPA